MEEKMILSEPEGYNSTIAKQMDLSYQGLQKGFIPLTNVQQSILQSAIIDNLADNYLFTMRYFGVTKSLFVLILRLLFLHNPIAECYAFLFTIGRKKVHLFERHKSHDKFLTFESNLLKDRPLVSVVIPTLNRYNYLKDVLSDLEHQTYTHFEVLVCDQSEPINENFYSNWNLDLKLIPQVEKALWLGRNRCIQAARGKFILLFDDDSRVQPDWIEQHLRCIDYFKVSISAGVTNTIVGHGMSPKENYFHLSDVFDTGNAMVRRNVFEVIGLFDRQFEKQRMGDGEFGLRALLGGFPLISNPYAQRIHLKVNTGGLRQTGSWDAIRPTKLFAPRPVPSVLYYIRKYFGDRQAILYIIQNVPFSYIPYKYKKSKILKVFCLLLLPAILPLVLWTTISSWKYSTIKLIAGPKISKLI